MISFWWKVFINGKELVDELENRRSTITGLLFSNPINGSDTLTINIADPEMLFIEDNIYTDNTPVYAQLGVHETLFVKEFSGYISAIDINFPESDTVTISLTAMDGSHVMNRNKKKRTWENTTNATVVQQIAKEYGFKCEVESGYSFKTEETISQDNKTDLELIEELAGNEDEKFYCKLVGDTIHYKKQGLLQTPVVGLTYRKYPFDLLSFQPQITIEDKKEEESTSDINTSTVQTQTYTVDSNTASRDVQGSSTPTTKTDTTSSSSNSSSSSNGKHVFDPKTQTWK